MAIRGSQMISFVQRGVELECIVNIVIEKDAFTVKTDFAGEGGGMCHLFNEKIIAGTNNMQIVSI